MHKPFKPFIENGIRQVLLVCKKSLKDLLYLFERQSESERARGINKGREGGWEGEGGRPSEHSSDCECVWSIDLPSVDSLSQRLLAHPTSFSLPHMRRSPSP